MPQLFAKSANSIARYLIAGTFVGLLIFIGLLEFGTRSSYATGFNQFVQQPIPFSHKHHVSGLGLDCRYCHANVDRGARPGLPATEICMSCHTQIWKNAAVLAPLRDSYASGRPIQWNKVHRLPDFVYFNHSIHVNKGVRCLTCHGEVNEMPLSRPVKRWEMKECLDCHRYPAKYLRPSEQTYSFLELPLSAEEQLKVGNSLLQINHIDGHRLVNCSVCHR